MVRLVFCDLDAMSLNPRNSLGVNPQTPLDESLVHWVTHLVLLVELIDVGEPVAINLILLGLIPLHYICPGPVASP